MAENNTQPIDTAQDGASILPTQLNVETPLLDRLDLENQFGGYRAPGIPEP